jgi:hemerythrin superfamily protein
MHERALPHRRPVHPHPTRRSPPSRDQSALAPQSGDPPMNAIDLLVTDHRTIRGLLEELSETTPRGVKTRQDLVEKIGALLKAHTTIEEEIFYPAFKEAGGKDEAKIYFEALEEHRAAGELVLPDLLATDPAGETFSGRAKVLKELVLHHVDEEEKDMFKHAKALLDQDQLKELGERMHERKQELLEHKDELLKDAVPLRKHA